MLLFSDDHTLGMILRETMLKLRGGRAKKGCRSPGLMTAKNIKGNKSLQCQQIPECAQKSQRVTESRGIEN